MEEKLRLLFVCLGNICRSPCAEAVFRHLAAQRGLANKLEIDSAGTGDWHVGELPDARMRRAGTARGYCLDSISRQIHAERDFSAFDYILVMDDANMADVRRLDRAGMLNGKVMKFTDFCTRHDTNEVPDPYYGGPDGFNHVIDIVEDACEGLLDFLEAEFRKEKG